MIEFRADVLPLRNRLYRLALRITQHTGEAEDIVQETMIRAWKHREELTGKSSAEAFCVTVCRNLSLDYLAKHERESQSLDGWRDDDDGESLQVADSSPSPLQKLQGTDGLAWVKKIFDQLPEKQRTIMHLRDVEGLSYKEIADALSITEEQVKVGLFRARQKMKIEFEKINRYGL